MALIPHFILPKNILSAIKRGGTTIQVSPKLTQAERGLAECEGNWLVQNRPGPKG